MAAAPVLLFPDLRDFDLDDLFRVTRTTELAIDWCRENGLLSRTMDCEDGDCLGGANPMRPERKDGTIDGLMWRCSVMNVCRKTFSIRKGSFFENSHLSIATIVRYMWSFEIDKQDFMQRELRIGSAHTIVDFKQFFRDICIEHFLMAPIVIGGPGHTVEIDESCFVRRKYNVGHEVDPQWVFGGYDVETRESFMVRVPDRSANTLIPRLMQFVLPGTTVISDLWASYNTVGNLGYTHLTVNHSQNFVDPITGATTNHVESVWQKAKEKNKRRFGTHRTMIDNYLGEFLWRQRFGNNGHAFHNLVTHIRDVYTDATS